MQRDFSGRLASLGLDFTRNAPMAKRTTLRVGGPADYLVEAHGQKDVSAALSFANAEGLPVLMLGNGSNLLIPDEGFRGLVVAMGGLSDIRIDGTCVHAGAGAPLLRIGIAAQQAGLGGLEALSGIPGSVGGAVFMNAGAYGSEMSEVVERVEALDGGGAPHALSLAEAQFGYRHSALMEKRWVVTSVTLECTRADASVILEKMNHYAEQRRAKQPLNMPSAGSFFKRPAGHFAGALIEAAGLKGVSVGGAQVSEKHAGFLVNTGDATASDFLALMRLIQTRVRDASGVWLEPEVRIPGCNLSC